MSRTRPIFQKGRQGICRVHALVVVAALTACAPEAAHWSPAQSVKLNDVRWVTFEHPIRFASGGETLGEAEKTRLRRFLALHDAGYGDDVMIGAAGGSDSVPGAASNAVKAARREAAVMAELRALDFRPRLLPETSAGALSDGAVVHLLLGRYVVVPPDCPDWSKPADGDPNNRVSSNFGCATATNLGLMVANPGDLVRGRRAGPADGAAGARLYRNYREGEQKQAPSVTPLVIQSGVGGGSGG
ncbi:MAG: CpaD family pilus assembly lipoprotein [Rhodospirillaceae bacterium]